jgi:ethanolaminephosphotransferase
MPYISPQGRTALLNYAYRGKTLGLLKKYVLDYWWNYSIRFVPWTMAPNLVTLLGTIAMVINLIVITQVAPDFQCNGACDRWIYLFSAACLFFYQTMDNLDGRQARRTGASSPLGQLFDHGCDALVTTIATIIAMTVINMGNNVLTFTEVMFNMVPFFIASWEEYHTGIFVLGYINGPEDGIFMVYMSYLVAVVTGGQIWETPMSELTGLKWMPNMQLNHFYLPLIAVALLITMTSSFYNVWSYKKQQNKPMGPAVRHLVSLVFFEGIVFLWYYLETPLWHAHMAWLLMMIGVLFGEIVGRLIVAHLCHEDIPFVPRPMYALALPLLNATLTRVTGVAYASPELIAIVVAGLVVLSYGHFAMAIINEICGLLKINCLSLTSAQLQAVRSKTK